MRRIALSCGLIWSLAACGGSQPEVATPELPKHHPWRLYPMLADSAWAYDVDTGDGDNVLAVTRVMNVIGNQIELQTGNDDVTRYEQREDGILRLGESAYLIRQPIQVGATWPSGGDKIATITAVDVSIEVPAGQYSECVAIEENVAETGLQIRTVYCPDVGPVEVLSHMQLRGQDVRVIARLRGAQVGGH